MIALIALKVSHEGCESILFSPKRLTWPSWANSKLTVLKKSCDFDKNCWFQFESVNFHGIRELEINEYQNIKI